MRTLGAGFYPLQSLRDGEIDGLIIAQLKMQAGEILGAAPIAAKKRVLADKIQSPRDITPVAFGQHQQHIVAQMRMGLLKKLPREIGCAPFARAGVLVKNPKGVPMVWLDLIAGEHFDLPAKTLRLGALLADVFALSAAEVGQKIVKGLVAVIDPVKLL